MGKKPLVNWTIFLDDYVLDDYLGVNISNMIIIWILFWTLFLMACAFGLGHYRTFLYFLLKLSTLSHMISAAPSDAILYIVHVNLNARFAYYRFFQEPK